MSLADKLIRGSGRAVGRLIDKTSTRIENARTDVIANTYTSDKLARDLVAQGFDVLQSVLDMSRAFSDRPPTVFIDAKVLGSGGPVLANTMVTLDEPVPALSVLQTTPLVSPGVSTTLTMTLERVPPPPAPAPAEIETLRVDVEVPSTQAPGLYHGFISTGQAVQAEVYVSVHT